MSVYAGEVIVEIESGKTLRVEYDLEIRDIYKARKFDFLARYEKSHAIRGFKMIDEGIVWNRK